MAKLKPCPFCGGDDIACIVTLSSVNIHCRKCKASISRGIAVGKCNSLKESEEILKSVAVDGWNTRTQQKEG